MTSRRDLYALGEPFGDSATRRKLGGGYVCGGGGDSSSASTQSTTNISNDRRQVVDTGSIGISSDSSSVSITSLDQGAIAGARDIALSALTSNSTNTAKLLDVAGVLFAGQQKALDVSASLANSLAAKSVGAEDAGLQTEATTMNRDRMLALAAVGGLAAWAFFKRKG